MARCGDMARLDGVVSSLGYIKRVDVPSGVPFWQLAWGLLCMGMEGDLNMMKNTLTIRRTFGEYGITTGWVAAVEDTTDTLLPLSVDAVWVPIPFTADANTDQIREFYLARNVLVRFQQV